MRILLVTAMRDEGPHLVEWIAHHKALGVTDFLVFTNDCSDGTDRLLDALAPTGVVHLPNIPPQGKSLQWNALKVGWQHPLRKEADWVLCIDSDEFINLRAPLNELPDLIKACGEADAVAMPWRFFGHSGQPRLTRGLTVETFTHASPVPCDYPVNARSFKTIFRAKGPFRQIGVHRPRLKKHARAAWVDGSGQPMPEGFDQAEQRLMLYGMSHAADLVQLNHYSVRSAQSFMLKQQRGLPNRKTKALDLTYWVERNFNTVKEVSIQRHLPGTKAAMDHLLALPGVADLHHAAHDHHNAAFEALMQDPSTVQFFGRLLLAATSTPLPSLLVQELVKMFQASHAD